MDSSKNKRIDLDSLMPIIREQLEGGNSVTFSPRGVSMLPMLHQGRDTVTLSPIEGKLKKYDLPLYKRDNGKYVLHRIVSVKDGITCVGDNQFAFERGLREDQMIAVVTSFNRNGKEISTNSTGYKLYCRFWHHTRLLRRIFRFVVGLPRRIIRKLKSLTGK
jgi:hypothetical protein